jgi:hypothetical protein
MSNCKATKSYGLQSTWVNPCTWNQTRAANRREDLRCQAVDNGARCSLDVKDGNSAIYKYCTQLRNPHLSTYNDWD